MADYNQRWNPDSRGSARKRWQTRIRGAKQLAEVSNSRAGTKIAEAVDGSDKQLESELEP